MTIITTYRVVPDHDQAKQRKREAARHETSKACQGKDGEQ